MLHIEFKKRKRKILPHLYINTYFGIAKYLLNDTVMYMQNHSQVSKQHSTNENDTYIITF